MKKIFDLQMFAEAVSGKKLVYLYRIMEKASTTSAVTLAFTTENTRTKSAESESTETKDGPVITPGAIEGKITCTSILTKDDTLIDELEDAMDNHKTVEVWEANLEQPATDGTNKFKGRYFQTTLTEMEKTSSAEDYVEVSLTFAINGNGAKGDVTVTAKQQEVAAYVFRDTHAGIEDPF